MSESTITAKDQTTVPKLIRDAIRAQPGTKLKWHVMSGGKIIVRAKTKSILEMQGMLKPPNKKKVRIEDMNP
ncbi:AbrB/MazE/SpoVT family DNA-binding domain-containing protein [Polaromonas jejuensis]|uniref:AbrB/MazE/SpoVT family DNA-binding domain-containing protein n=1 Tax=Polaromonas jejuensis TaxID=457502 RepID=A0ABW0Q7R4_9BURK|nr:type II toxin-antitoxin system PrlF family antitoxin [Polaromonas jejuensis]